MTSRLSTASLLDRSKALLSDPPALRVQDLNKLIARQRALASEIAQNVKAFRTMRHSVARTGKQLGKRSGSWSWRIAWHPEPESSGHRPARMNSTMNEEQPTPASSPQSDPFRAAARRTKDLRESWATCGNSVSASFK